MVRKAGSNKPLSPIAPELVRVSSAPKAKLVMITGLSGSGKITALKVFEDMGYYCVDNLPAELIPSFAQLIEDTRDNKNAAIVVDIREGSRLEQLPKIIGDLKKRLDVTLIYLDTTDKVLVRRFSETRRPHPLGAASSVPSSIISERRRLEQIRNIADLEIDTSKFNVHELRTHLVELFKAGDERQPLLVSSLSFGFKNGVPESADLVFDVRFLPNPHFIAGVPPLHGQASAGGKIHPFVSADPGIHRQGDGPAVVSAAPLRRRRQELPDHRLWLHRRPAPVGVHGRGDQEAPCQGGLPRQGGASRQPKIDTSIAGQ